MKSLKELEFSDTQMSYFSREASARGMTVADFIESYTRAYLQSITSINSLKTAQIVSFKSLKSSKQGNE
ncbi:hypothetical protein ACOI22_03500 [Glaciecola sp. 2405UD65-10]|uniref:hypothetical protein n=1 Tax=Glaciecola sp. 2405UD65-10 TaxID=3397244 RepID=UPI003B594DC6